MLKPRLAGTIIVKNQIVVQSIGFKKYLPIGNVKNSLKNLSEWEVDEIYLIDIDSTQKKTPNFKLIDEVSKLRINTPLVYGGGINSSEHAREIIKKGFEKIIISNLLFQNPSEIIKIFNLIGKESLIINLIFKKFKKNYLFFDTLNNQFHKIDLDKFFKKFSDYFSEILLMDYNHDGVYDNFDKKIINFNKFGNKNFILMGGISINSNLKILLKNKRIRSIAIGNYLNYKESSIFNIKKHFKNEFRK